MEELDINNFHIITANYNKLHTLACIFSYPTLNISLSLRRIEELFSIGIEKFFFVGDTHLCNTRILGKGTNCLVVKCIYKSRDAVVKFLRIDSNRRSLELEAEILKKIEPLDLAPKIYVYSDWYIVEEYIPGESLVDYTRRIKDVSQKDVYTIIRDMLCKAVKLDVARVDHGELNRPKKHIRITRSKRIFFIDFESASMSRSPKNLTSIVQFLLNHEVWRHYIYKLTGIKSTEFFYKILREYKQTRDVQQIMNKFGIKCF